MTVYYVKYDSDATQSTRNNKGTTPVEQAHFQAIKLHSLVQLITGEEQDQFEAMDRYLREGVFWLLEDLAQELAALTLLALEVSKAGEVRHD